ncbi:MAG: hypothetical protein OES09_07390 [Gammaproteobacteria bacterium]|nr:hypothetical protein [Gammaproteobacteria bacterium]
MAAITGEVRVFKQQRLRATVKPQRGNAVIDTERCEVGVIR